MRYEGLPAEQRRIETRLKKIVDAIAEGVSARTLKDEMLSMEARQDEIDALLAAQPKQKPLIHPGLAELYRSKVEALQDCLEAEETRDEAMELIRSLVDAIVLTPENGELRIDLNGELAGILALAAESKRPAGAIADGQEQIKMVAGVGFEPTTFRL